MYVIAKDVNRDRFYILNTVYDEVEASFKTQHQCERCIKYITFHDFYYSVKDSYGRSMTPKPTIHYYEMTHNRLKPASGWWSRTLRTTVPTNNEDDFDRFRLCAHAS